MKKSPRAQSLERSESLATEVLNLNPRAQDNPTVMRTNYCTNLATILVTLSKLNSNDRFLAQLKCPL